MAHLVCGPGTCLVEVLDRSLEGSILLPESAMVKKGKVLACCSSRNTLFYGTLADLAQDILAGFVQVGDIVHFSARAGIHTEAGLLLTYSDILYLERES